MFKLAFRNLLREKRRTFLTSTILTIATMYYIVITGMLDGFEKTSIKNFIELNAAHIKVFKRGYDETTFKGSLKNYKGIMDGLRRFNFIRATTVRLKLNGFITDGRDQFPVVITGILPDRDSMVFKLNRYLKGGRLSKGVWIGRNVAKYFNLRIGDSTTLMFRSKDEIVYRRLVIEGILDVPYPEINKSYIFTDLNLLREYGGMDDVVTEIDIITKNYKKVKRYKEKISRSIEGIETKTWVEEGSDFLTLSKTKNLNQFVILFFIVLIGIIGTANTLLISIFEKIREIGTLKAIGMTDGEVMALFILEGTLIGVIGSVSGVILGSLTNLYLSIYGINITSLVGDMYIGYKVMGVVRSTWSVKAIVFSLLLGPTSTSFASYFPARRAKRMSPAECLRWV